MKRYLSTGLENDKKLLSNDYLFSCKGLTSYGCGTWNSTIETALIPGNQNKINGSQNKR